MAAKKGGAEDDEIVASGEALRTVAGWLGVSDADAVLEAEGLSAEYEQGRVQGLGLGAKFLPHHKAVALTAGVEHRLSSKLKRTAERQAAAAGGGAPAGRHHGGAHQHPGAAKHAALLQHGRHHAAGRGQDKAAPPAEQQRQRQQAGSEEEEDSEAEEGRGRAFGKGKGKAAARPAILSRGDLLKVSGLPGKKRKRKSGGGSGAAGS